MDRRLAQSFHALIALLALSAPVVAALYLAVEQSFKEHASLTKLYADDVMRRSEDSARQIAHAFDGLRRIPVERGCSDEGLRLMEQLHVPSDRLQTVGLIRDGRLMCSSLGLHGDGIPLPPPRYLSKAGDQVRVDTRLPWSDDQTFLLVTDAATGYTAVVHPQIPIDVAPGMDGVAVGVVGLSSGTPLMSRGAYSPAWLAQGLQQPGEAFVSDGQVVVVLASVDNDMAAYAALPYEHVREVLWSKALVLVPIALAAGGVLAYLGIQLLRHQQSITAQIRNALRTNEFFLLYQPIVDLADGRTIGAEALVRWKRRDGEVVRPDIFIPAAEARGLIRQITARVLDLAAADLGDLFARHPHFHLAVNLSPADLHAAETVDRLKTFVARSGAGPGNLMVEATERGFVNSDLATPIVSSIRAEGIRVAIDDFGTGYSSLAQLQSMALDYLKIDKCFVDTIGTEAATSQVVLHIIAMAKGLRLKMIAEGVETAQQATLLADQGVDHAQGWHFGKPVPMSELRARLEREAGAA